MKGTCPFECESGDLMAILLLAARGQLSFLSTPTQHAASCPFSPHPHSTRTVVLFPHHTGRDQLSFLHTHTAHGQLSFLSTPTQHAASKLSFLHTHTAHGQLSFLSTPTQHAANCPFSPHPHRTRTIVLSPHPYSTRPVVLSLHTHTTRGQLSCLHTHTARGQLSFLHTYNTRPVVFSPHVQHTASCPFSTPIQQDSESEKVQATRNKSTGPEADRSRSLVRTAALSQKTGSRMVVMKLAPVNGVGWESGERN